MKIFYAKRSLFVILGLVVVFGLGYWSGKFSGGGSWPTMGLLAREMPIFSVKKAGEVCLTFDISWGEKTLPLVLKVL